ncbi:MAG: carbonic anhydrase, partial [Gemmatimonadetes bacterium]|nr:carbonic anhydrase [Gemmatimonadota bacterium]
EGAVGFWLTELRELAAQHRDEIDPLPELMARANRLSEINVVAQLRNVLLSPAYLKAREAGTPPTVHGWMLDLSTGLIRELELPVDDWRREGLL